VQGQGQAELGLGGQGVLGRLDHSPLALLKNFDFHYRPTTAPLRNKYILDHCPVTTPTKKQK